MSSSACSDAKIERLQDSIKSLTREIVLLLTELEHIKNSRFEEGSYRDDAITESLDEQNGVYLKQTLQSLEANEFNNTSDFEDDEETIILQNHQEDNERLIEEVIEISTASNKIPDEVISDLSHDDDSNDYDNQEQQSKSINSKDCNYIEDNDGDDEDSEDFEDEEWQCMHCRDWNSVEEYFCFTCALTQTEEAYQHNIYSRNHVENIGNGNQDFANQRLKIVRIQPFDYDYFDDEDSDGSEDEEWQCMRCKDWSSIEEYFCFTCALTQTEEAYAEMN